MLLCRSPWAVTFTNIPLLPSSLRWFRKAEGPGVGEILLSSLSTGRHWPLSWRVPWVYLTMAGFLRIPAKANREHSWLGFLVGFLQIKPLKMCMHPKLRPPGILLHRVQIKSPVIHPIATSMYPALQGGSSSSCSREARHNCDSGFTCLCRFWWQRFLWPHFTDGSKDGYWYFSLFFEEQG